MRTTHKRVAVITAMVLGLTAPAAVAASAHEPKVSKKPASAAANKPAKPTATADQVAKAAKAAKAAKVKKNLNAFVSAGTVTAVNVAAGTITFTVQGGRDKALRGKPLTVLVTATTKIHRGEAVATLATVLVGDHVNVKGTKAGTVYTATRVAASAAEVESDKD